METQVSRRSIEDYYQGVEKIKQYSGTAQELSIRSEFANLLNVYCKSKNLLLVQELEYRTKKGTLVKPDGSVKDALRLDWGYWESKDEHDILDKEIEAKIKKGYPTSNTIFEDSQTAVLFQQGNEVCRCAINDSEKLDALMQQFINYEREEIKDFRKAIERFKEDLPIVLTTLRDLIDEQGRINSEFQRSRDGLLLLCQEAINPKLTILDIREMLIQHILTEEIFVTIFNESQFHRENAIAKELQKVAETFFAGKVRRETLGLIDHYYLAIKAAASNIQDHHEKQKFLKVLYELFYRTYNPKSADRLGIFYTPNEIVEFIVKSADYLAFKHFGRLLSDSNVEILDPAAGTGTFITELIEYIPKTRLEYKYNREIHCNEVAILPYYIANLNIEYTYKQKMAKYEPLETICFVDTLDNTGFSYKNKQFTLFDIGTDNLERIKRQNTRKISVIIGNPPYNANQLNENENNKNREYPIIDERIRDTYVKLSNATKTKVYDMYARFYRWASDRLDKNGIIAFITNRSFIDKYTYDGFRKTIQNEFNAAYIIDTKSDVRANPKISGTKYNVFGIQTGVAVMFLVRSESQNGRCLIQYFSLRDEQPREEKLRWFASSKFEEIAFEHLEPDKTGDWITTANNDFHKLLPLVSVSRSSQSIFAFYSIGVSTNRDEWVFDFDETNLSKKMKFFIDTYNKEMERIRQIERTRRIKVDDLGDLLQYDIKWSSALKDKLLRHLQAKFDKSWIIDLNYRPYTKRKYYSDKTLSDRLTANHYKIFGKNLTSNNKVICFTGVSSTKPFGTLASNKLWSLDYIEKTQGVPLFTYNGKKREDNVTDWAQSQFWNRYHDKSISKQAIFNYVYAILHDSVYRTKYEGNLKRELPRIPFYENFWKWSECGEQLMNLHTDYEAQDFIRLKRVEHKNSTNNVAKLKADKRLGIVILDDSTSLEGVPKVAWEYKIGNRSAIEWILDQYKEKIPKESIVKEKFYTYQFQDFKEQVLDLILKTTRVSVETMRIIESMNGESR